MHDGKKQTNKQTKHWLRVGLNKLCSVKSVLRVHSCHQRTLQKIRSLFHLKELSDGILSYFGRVQNYLLIEENPEIVAY